jgi:hypothetical protein
VNDALFPPKEGRVFASRFWGFSPATHPVVTFGKSGHLKRLLKLSAPSDYVLFVGTQAEPTLDQERGRILGLSQFGRVEVDPLDLIDPAATNPHEFVRGKYKWPKGLPILRAWKFDDRPKLVDTIGRQLSMYATVGVIELTEEEKASVFALAMSPVEVRRSEAFDRIQTIADDLARRGPTLGLVASSWSGEVTRDVGGQAFTYAARFGNRDIWKIGWAKDVMARCADLNKHVPVEALNESWRMPYSHKWASGEAANRMEQRVLENLDSFRSEGERVVCTEKQLVHAWTSTLVPK